MYSDIQRKLIDNACERIQVENVTKDDVKIKFRVEENDTNIKLVDNEFDITYMFTVDDIASIVDELDVNEAIRNIAITCVYFFGHPLPSSISDVVWNLYIYNIEHSE